jgi:hypothetical protein
VEHRPARQHVLDPVERVSEILFGLVMVLGFTGSMSAATAGRAEVREMLVGAIGCNLAWGIVDAVMYLMSTLLSRARGLAILRTVRADMDGARGRTTIQEAMNPHVASLLGPEVFEAVRQDLIAAPPPPERTPLTLEDLRGAGEVFLLVFTSTLPVIVPFIVSHDAPRALRVSNGIAVAMLCIGGFSLAKHSGLNPWLTGIAMAALGAALVAITIALGG